MVSYLQASRPSRKEGKQNQFAVASFERAKNKRQPESNY